MRESLFQSQYLQTLLKKDPVLESWPLTAFLTEEQYKSNTFDLYIIYGLFNYKNQKLGLRICEEYPRDILDEIRWLEKQKHVDKNVQQDYDSGDKFFVLFFYKESLQFLRLKRNQKKRDRCYLRLLFQIPERRQYKDFTGGIGTIQNKEEH